MVSNVKTQTRKALEVAFVYAALIGINLQIGENPGFITYFSTPYLLPPLFFALLYGTFWGILSLTVGVFSAAFFLPLITWIPFFRIEPFPAVPNITAIISYLHMLFTKAGLSLGISIITIFSAASIVQALADENSMLRSRFRFLSRNNWNLKKTNRALSQVNHELEERVFRQKGSITMLYSQLNKLNSFQTENVISVLAETVRIFTNANQLSVWKFNPERDCLEPVHTLGWSTEEEKEAEMIALNEDTIEGWVFRNNTTFSIRMLLKYENLHKLDRKTNIITMPIHVSNKVWGLVNIESMPFVKYNDYTENIAQIILALAEPPLHRAVEYENLLVRSEIDDITGLPSFSEFYKILEQEIEKGRKHENTVSIIIIEITNFDEIKNAAKNTSPKKLIPEIIQMLRNTSEYNADFFHYKEENQIAILFPHLDFDGTSMFCMEAMEQFNSLRWTFEGHDFALESIIGYAVFNQPDLNPQDLIDQAENLLNMQKVVS